MSPTYTLVLKGGIRVAYRVSDNKAILQMDIDKINEIISSTSGNEVVFNLSGLKNILSVQIPGILFDALAKNNLNLTIKLPEGTMTLINEVLASIYKQTGGVDISIEIRKRDRSELSEAQKAAVEKDDIVLDINIVTDTQIIREFNGLLEMTVPYNGSLPVGLWYLNDKGELERKNCKYSNGMVYFNLDYLSLYVLAKDMDWKNPFSDAKESSWYYDAVIFIAQRGITLGTSKTTFSPNDNLSRGQVITMLLRAYDIEPDLETEDNFSDGEQTWYTGYLAAAKALGVAKGVGSNHFLPEQDITRQEMFTMIHRTLRILKDLPSTKSGKSLADFSDKNTISDWAEEALKYLVEWGIVIGNEGRINPSGTATRAEIARVLFRLFADKEQN